MWISLQKIISQTLGIWRIVELDKNILGSYFEFFKQDYFTAVLLCKLLLRNITLTRFTVSFAWNTRRWLYSSIVVFSSLRRVCCRIACFDAMFLHGGAFHT
jgi:hypothetical protein